MPQIRVPAFDFCKIFVNGLLYTNTKCAIRLDVRKLMYYNKLY